jgi:hypothetical protein
MPTFIAISPPGVYLDSDGNRQTVKWNENVNRELKNAANGSGVSGGRSLEA